MSRTDSMWTRLTPTHWNQTHLIQIHSTLTDSTGIQTGYFHSGIRKSTGSIRFQTRLRMKPMTLKMNRYQKSWNRSLTLSLTTETLKNSLMIYSLSWSRYWMNRWNYSSYFRMNFRLKNHYSMIHYSMIQNYLMRSFCLNRS